MAGIFATAGAKMYIGLVMTVSATPKVLADFNAQSWVEISWVESIGAFGDVSAEITFDSIGEGRTRKLKGNRNAGNLALVCGIDSQDHGQVSLRAAEATDFSYGFKVQFDDAPLGGTPSLRYFTAKVMSAAEALETANNVVKLNASLGIDSNIVRVSASG